MEAQEGLASHGKRRIGSFQMKRNAESALSQHAAGWRDLLKTKDFGWLWAGQVVSQLGDGLTKVALLWFVYTLTGSALKMTLIGVLQTIPPLAFGAFAGVLIDRVPKRAAMITIDLVRAALLVLIPLLYAMGLLSLPWLYVLVFVGSLFAMAFGPALNASVPLLVKRNQLVRANAIMQSSMTIGQLLGPAISGILIAVIGAQNVLYVNAAAFVLSALCKLPIHIPHPRSSGKRFSAREALRDLKEGFRFVFIQERFLLLLMVSASLCTMAATGFIYMLPVFGERVLHTTSVQLGWLWSALSLGIFVTTIWLAFKKEDGFCRRLWIIGGAAAVGGAAVFALTAAKSFVLAAVIIVVIGGSSGLVTPIVSASLQQLTPQDLLARVFSVFNTAVMALAMIGMTAVGWASDRFGPFTSLVGIGTVQLVAACSALVVLPWCRQLSDTVSKTTSAKKRTA